MQDNTISGQEIKKETLEIIPIIKFLFHKSYIMIICSIISFFYGVYILLRLWFLSNLSLEACPMMMMILAEEK